MGVRTFQSMSSASSHLEKLLLGFMVLRHAIDEWPCVKHIPHACVKGQGVRVYVPALKLLHNSLLLCVVRGWPYLSVSDGWVDKRSRRPYLSASVEWDDKLS